MTIQDRIDEVVALVENALGRCGDMTPEDREHVLNGVKDLGFQWQKSNAHGRASCVLFGLIDKGYSGEVLVRFVRECVQMKQMDEIQKKEVEGSYYTFRLLPMPEYAALIDLLMVQAIEGAAGVYDPRINVYGGQGGQDDREPAQVEVETVEQVPDVKAEPAKKAPAKKTTSRTATKKTTAKKTGRAADGK